MNRERLLNRRLCESFDFNHGGLDFTLCTARYADGRIAEVFLSSSKVGSAVQAIARDAAIVMSIALQHGAHIETIRSALTQDHDGAPATVLGAALEAMERVGEHGGEND